MRLAPRQPVGLHQPPAAFLLLPHVADDQDATERLMRGDLNAAVPADWRFFVAAAQGDAAHALRLLPASDAPLILYNRFVLQGDPYLYADVAARLDGPLRSLVACAAYAMGAPASPPSTDALEGELLALALATVAAADIEAGRHAAADDALQRAAAAARGPSPVLAAVLLGQRADLAAVDPEGSPALAMMDLREALRLAEQAQLPLLRAELWMKLGMLLQQAATQQQGVLLEAINCYQSALHEGISERDQPDLFAQIQCNLGLAYLSLPEDGPGGHLRHGVAVQSFRHALRIHTRDDHPDMWARISMNLANALQHAPSSHRQDNLIQAVEVYEQVLQVRVREKDPVEYATVLMNQANALAHLGIFKPAIEKLSEACKLFSWHDHEEHAQAARDLMDQISQRQGAAGDAPTPVEAAAN